MPVSTAKTKAAPTAVFLIQLPSLAYVYQRKGSLKNESAGKKRIIHAFASSQDPPEVIPSGMPLCEADSAMIKNSVIT